MDKQSTATTTPRTAALDERTINQIGAALDAEGVDLGSHEGWVRFARAVEAAAAACDAEAERGEMERELALSEAMRERQPNNTHYRHPYAQGCWDAWCAARGVEQ